MHHLHGSLFAPMFYGKCTFYKPIGTYLHYIWFEFSIVIQQIDAIAAPSKGAIWDEFSEQHQNQSIQKPYIMRLALFWCK